MDNEARMNDAEIGYLKIILAVVAAVILLGFMFGPSPEYNPYGPSDCDRGLGYESC